METEKIDPNNIGAHNPVGVSHIPGITSDEDIKNKRNPGKIPGITPGLIPKGTKPHYLFIDDQHGLTQQQWDMIAGTAKPHTIIFKDNTEATGTAKVLIPQKPGDVAKNFFITDGKEMQVGEQWFRSVAEIEEADAAPADKKDSGSEAMDNGIALPADFPKGMTLEEFESLNEKKQYKITFLDADHKQQTFTGYPETNTKKVKGVPTTTYMMQNDDEELKIDPTDIIKVEAAQ